MAVCPVSEDLRGLGAIIRISASAAEASRISSPLMHGAVHGTGGGEVGTRSSSAAWGIRDGEDAEKRGSVANRELRHLHGGDDRVRVFILGAIILVVVGALIACDLLVPALVVLFLAGIVALGRFLG